MDDDVRAAVAAIPMLAGYSGAVERLGGLTNRVYRLGGHCLRIPGKGTEEYINRANEAVAAREAAKAGVSPDVLYFDAATGLMVTRFIDGAETMSPEKFKARAGAPARAGAGVPQAARQRRGVPVPLRAVRDDRRYLKVLVDQGRGAAGGLPRRGARGRPVGARRARRASNCRSPPATAIRSAKTSSTPAERMWIVDWEYAGMNDPMWDLGDLSVEAAFERRAGRGDDARLFRRRAKAGRARPHRHLQGDVRPAVDAMGPDPARQQQPGRRFLGLCQWPLRALQGDDGSQGFCAPCG